MYFCQPNYIHAKYSIDINPNWLEPWQTIVKHSPTQVPSKCLNDITVRVLLRKQRVHSWGKTPPHMLLLIDVIGVGDLTMNRLGTIELFYRVLWNRYIFLLSNHPSNNKQRLAGQWAFPAASVLTSSGCAALCALGLAWHHQPARSHLGLRYIWAGKAHTSGWEEFNQAGLI